MRVDFYITNNSDTQSCYPLACRLLEKAYAQKHSVYVHTENEQQAQLLNQQLWTFRDISFIPHNLVNETCALSPPVQIGFQQVPEHMNDLMLNLSLDIPSCYNRFARIMEIVPAEQTWKTALREHFRFYREQGCQLFNHQMG